MPYRMFACTSMAYVDTSGRNTINKHSNINRCLEAGPCSFSGCCKTHTHVYYTYTSIQYIYIGNDALHFFAHLVLINCCTRFVCCRLRLTWHMTCITPPDECKYPTLRGYNLAAATAVTPLGTDPGPGPSPFARTELQTQQLQLHFSSLNTNTSNI